MGNLGRELGNLHGEKAGSGGEMAVHPRRACRSPKEERWWSYSGRRSSDQRVVGAMRGKDRTLQGCPGGGWAAPEAPAAPPAGDHGAW